MICCFPVHGPEIPKLKELLRWILALGTLPNHQALIVVDKATPYQSVLQVKSLAAQIFGDVKLTSTEKSVHGWPMGANSLFRQTCKFVAMVSKKPFLLMETDAIPLRAGWLDEIEAEYLACGKNYMGAFYKDEKSDSPTMPKLYMSGIGVYHAFTARDLHPTDASPWAWDVEHADIFTRDGHDTGLICHVWGQRDDPPKFAEIAIASTSTFSLKSIPKEAAIFHRNKDGSLIRELRKKNGVVDPIKDGGFVVVLPFFNRDAPMVLKHLKWQRDLNCCSKWDCLLSFEASTNPDLVTQIESVAKECYKNVHILKYTPAPDGRWPQGPNWAFQHAAMHMRKVNRAWLWMESDMWALTPDWLDKLQEEYASCGKAFMGHIVKDFGHLQGTSVYPADLPLRCPKVMSCTDIAFDTISKEEMLQDCHSANNLFSHIWGMHGGEPHHFTGTPMNFATIEQVNKWVPKGAVTLHRCKDGSIVDRLREMKIA